MQILITGGAGFVGSNLAVSLKKNYPNYQITAFDNLKRRGAEFNLLILKESGIEFVHGDIRNTEDLDFGETFDLIIDASAEPSVLAGINSSPLPVISNNLIGTVNLLEFARKNHSKFIFLSTSRVYSINQLNNIELDEEDEKYLIGKHQNITGISDLGITEEFPLTGYRSFYGTTKLASELLVNEYVQFSGLKAIINRCGVISGPGQMGKIDQGVAVLWMAKHFWKDKLSYIGYKGKQVRDLLHIDDLYKLIDLEIQNFNKLSGETFNVGGGQLSHLSLIEMTKLCEEITGNNLNIQAVDLTRDADIKLYISDNSKIFKSIGWQPNKTPKEIMTDIFSWIQKNELQLKPILRP